MSLTDGLLLDATCPIEPDHPLNKRLISDYTIPALSGWRGGSTLRDMVRTTRAPDDGSRAGTVLPSWGGSAGRPGGYGSLSFSGSNSSRVTLTTQFDISAGVSYFAWIRPGSVAAGTRAIRSNKKTIFGQFGSSLIWYADSGIGSIADNVFTLSAGVWYFVGVTQTGTTYQFWVNGQPGRTGTTNALNNTTYAATIGSFNTSFLYNGLLDSVLDYDCGLSAGEASALYLETRRSNPERFRWLRPWSFGVSATGGGTQTATAGTAAISISGASPTATASGTATGTAGTATISLTGTSPASTATGSASATAGTAPVSIAAVEPSASAAGTLTGTPTAADVTASGVAPDASGTSSATATPDAGAVTIASTSPEASATGAVSETPGAALVTLSGADPAASGTGVATSTAGTASVAISGAALAASGSGIVTSTPDVGAVTITGIDPTASGTGLTATAGVVTVSASIAAITISGTSYTSVDVGWAAVVIVGVPITVTGGGVASVIPPIYSATLNFTHVHSTSLVITFTHDTLLEFARTTS